MALRNLSKGGGKEKLNSSQEVKVLAVNQISVGDTVYTISGPIHQFSEPISSAGVLCACINSSGNLLFIGGSFYGRGKLFSISESTLTYVSDIYADNSGTVLSAGANSAAFSPDGTKLIVGGAFDNKAKLYSINGTTVTYISDIYDETGINNLSSNVRVVCFIPSSNKFILGGLFNWSLNFYNISIYTPIYITSAFCDSNSIKLNYSTVSAVFSPDCKLLVLSGDFTGKAKLYTVSGATLTYISDIYADNSGTVLSSTVNIIAFSPSGDSLVIGGQFTGGVKLYSVSGTTITCILDTNFNVNNYVSCLAFSPDGTKLILGGQFTGYAKLYSVNGTTVTYVGDIYSDMSGNPFTAIVNDIAFSPDGTKLVICGNFTGYAKLYTISGITITYVSDIYADSGTAPLSNYANSAKFTSDGTRLILGGYFSGYAKLYTVSGTTITYVSDIYNANNKLIQINVRNIILSPDDNVLIINLFGSRSILYYLDLLHPAIEGEYSVYSGESIPKTSLGVGFGVQNLSQYSRGKIIQIATLIQ